MLLIWRLLAQSGAASPEYRKGFEIIRAQLWNALAKQGLQPIEAVGKQFDPHLHHAIENVATADQPEGTVIGEMQPGYMFHDRVLRPAMVRVASAPENLARARISTRDMSDSRRKPILITRRHEQRWQLATT